MAMTAKRNAVSSSAKTVNTKWLNNAMRSIGVSTKEVLKDISPNVYEVVSTGVKTSKDAIQYAKSGSGGASRVTESLKNNKYVKAANTAYKNALADLASGKLNNTERAEQAIEQMMFGDDSGSSSFDESFSFGDMDEDGGSTTTNVQINTSNDGAISAGFASLEKRVTKNAEAQVKASKASTDAFIAVSSANLMQVEKIGSEIIGHLSNISNSLTAINQYNTDNMTRFIDSSLAFYEKIGGHFVKAEKQEDMTPKGTALFNNSDGGINISSYKEYVKKQFKTVFGRTGAGQVNSLLDADTLNTMVANPLGFASEALVKYMMPKVVTSTIEGVEKSFSAFMPSLLSKLATFGEGQASGVGSSLGAKLKKTIGEVFGVRVEQTTHFDKAASIEHGAVPFDGITKHAITEVITKELREQTSYLKAIAEHYKIDTKAIRNNTKVFNYKTGKYDTQENITNTIIDQVRNARLSTMKDGQFGDAIQGITNDSNLTPDQRKAMSNIVDEFLLRLVKHNKYIDMQKTSSPDSDELSDLDKILKSLKSDDNDENLVQYFSDYVKSIGQKNKIASMDVNRAIMAANTASDQAIKNINDNPYYYNLFTAKVDKDINDLVFRRQKKIGAKNAGAGMTDEELQQARIKRDSGANNNQNHVPSPVKYSGDGFFNQTQKTFSEMTENVGSHLQGGMSALIHGNADQLFSHFTEMVSDQVTILGKSIKDNFLLPLKYTVLGVRDNNGFSKGGIFSGIVNTVDDGVRSLKWQLTGKAYKDSNGKSYPDKEDSVFSKLSSIGSTIKESVMVKLFGEINEKTGKREKGIFGHVADTFKEGFDGWSEALFGASSKDGIENEREKIKENVLKQAKDALPSALAGTVVGAGAGSMAGGLLGTMVGGPIGGAILGTAAGFASRSEGFQDWLFGKKDKTTGKREDNGFISKTTQDFVSEHKHFLIGSAVVGAAKGTLLGGGVLGTLVGGPVAGALTGLATGIVLKSNMFHEFLFGSEKSGQKGVYNIVKGLFKGHQNAEEASSAGVGKKAIGMGLIGAGAGALTAGVLGHVGVLGAALAPFGPIGGAIGGLALAIRAQKDTFHDWLFGEKDDKGNTTREGVLGQFRNMLQVSVLTPLKNRMKDFGEQAMFALKYDVFRRIELSIEPLAEGVQKMLSPIVESVKNGFTSVVDSAKDLFANKIIARIDDYIIAPIKAVTNAAATIVFKTVKNIATFPFKVLSFITSPFVRIFAGIATKAVNIIERVALGVGKKILGGIGKVTKGLFSAVSMPFKLAAGIANYVNDKRLNIGGEGFATPDHTGESGDTTNKQRKGFNIEERAAEWKNLMKTQKERHYRNANEQAIARATGYQKFEDTEENRRLAELASKKKINWHKMDAIKSKPAAGSSSADGVEIDKIVNNPKQEDLDVETRQLSVLQQILNVITGKLPNGKENKKRGKSKGRGKGKAYGKESPNEPKNEEEQNPEATESTDEPKTDEATPEKKEKYQTDAAAIAEDIKAAGGVGKYFKGKIASFATSVKNKSHQAKEGINSLLSKFHIRGFANGTTNAPNDVIAVGEEGPELMVAKGGESIVSGRKPISVYVTGVASNVSASIGGLWSKAKNLFSKPKNNATHTDSSDARQMAMETGDTSIISNMHSNDADTEENQEQLEDDMNAAIVAKKGRDSRDEAIDKGFTSEESKELRQKEKDDARMDDIKDELQEQTAHQKKFGNLWSSIFSKKGIMTGLVIAAIPFLYKMLKKLGGIGTIASSLLSSVSNSISHIASNFSFTTTEGALGNGDSTVDKLVDNAEDLGDAADSLLSGDVIGAANTFVYDENGNIDHQSGARAKLLSKTIATKSSKIAGSLMGVGSKNGANALIDWGTSKLTSTVGKKTAENTAASVVEHVAASSADDVAETVTKNSNKLMKKVIEYIKKFASDVVSKVSNKLGEKLKDTFLSKLVDKVVKCVEKHFPSISQKISTIFGITTGLAATGVGLLAKEGTWIVLGALNGVSGASRLFKVDSEYVDGTMTAISAAMGAFSGTTLGSVIDVVNELVTDVLGIDFYSEIASLIYNTVAGSDKYDKLLEGQEDFKQDYTDYQEEELSTQYATMQAAGLLSSDVNLEDYISGAKSGEYASSYKSFADYNSEQHKTLGSKVLGGLKGAAGGIAGAFKSAGSALFGSKSTTYSDSNGNTYTDNGDGTYQVTSADGTDLGYVGKDVLEGVELTENVTKKKGIIAKAGGFIAGAGKTAASWVVGAGKAIGGAAISLGKGAISLKNKAVGAVSDFFLGKKTDAWYDSEGAYYVANNDAYDYYSANGDLLTEGVDSQEVRTMIKSGQLTKGVIQKDSGMKTLITAAGNKLKSGWDAFYGAFSSVTGKLADVAGSAINATVSFVSDKASKLKSFLIGNMEDAWYDTDGGYYVANGSSFDYYSANGDLLSVGTTSDTIVDMIKSGQLTEGYIREESGIMQITKSAAAKLKTGWNAFAGAIGDVASGIKEKAGSAINTAASFVSSKKDALEAFLVGKTETAWYDTDGGYYVANGSSFDYYSANGDLLTEGTDSDIVTSLISSGQLTEGTIKTTSGVKKITKTVGSNLKAGWDTFSTSIVGFTGKVKNAAGSVINSASNFVSNKRAALTEFLIGKTESAWYDTDGGYYVANGETYDYYNQNGDLISTEIDADTVTDMINTGVLTEGEIVTEATLKTKINERVEKAKDALGSIADKAAVMFGSIAEKGSEFIEGIQENGLFGFKKFFSKKSSEVWFDPNGNYYKLNGSTYDYYNANNDLIASGISADEVNDKKAAGILTIGTIQQDSEAKKAISSIQSAVKDAWSKAKSTVSSGWNAFTKWLTGGSGSGVTGGGYGIGSLTEDDFGSTSITRDAGKASTKRFTANLQKFNYPTDTSSSSSSSSSNSLKTFSYPTTSSSSLTVPSISSISGGSGRRKGFFFKGGRGTRKGNRGGRGPSGVLFIGDSWTADTYFQSKWSGCQFKAVIGVTANYWLGKTGGASGVSAVSVMLGLNGRDVSAMEKLIDEIISNYPNVPFIIQRCPHVRSTYSSYGLTGADLNSQIDQFNSQIQSYVSGLGNSNVRWVDTTSCLQDSDGFLKKDLANGDYHLNSSGVDTWVPAIENALNGGSTSTSTAATTTTGTTSTTTGTTSAAATVTTKRTLTEKIGDFFTEVGSRAASGLITGKYDTDFSSVLGGDGKGARGGGRGDDDSKSSTVNGYTYYSQNDSRWKDTPYTQRDGSEADATMGTSGCGPTAFSMVASNMTGEDITPVETAAFARSTGFRDDTGTNWSFMENAANAYGIPSITQYNPTSDFISSELAAGRPMILSGTDDGSVDQSAYTSAGHYVVAVGQDGNGNVLVNDPRGKEYSKRIPLNKITSQTGAAWSFGGRGPANKKQKFKFNSYLTGKSDGGGRGDVDTWIAIVQALKAAIAAKQPGYDQNNYISITIGGVTKSVRTDCSGLVTGAMKFYGVLSDGTNLWTGNMMDDSSPMKSAGFTRRAFTSWDNLAPGDVVVRHDSHKHTEIYAGKKDGSYYVYNCGSTKSVNNPNATGRSYDTYSVVWTPGEPGKDCITGLTISDTGLDSSSSSSTTTSTTSSSTSSLSALDAISGFFSEVGNRAVEGLLTGNFNTDFSSYFNPTTSDSSSDSSISSGTYSGSDYESNFWSYFKEKGIPDTGIAGLMGNIYHESGVKPGQVEYTLLNKLGTTSEQYTSDVDSGAISKETFLHPLGGSTQYGYGLAQWTSPGRKEGLYNLVKSNNKSISDMGSQLDWLWTELNSDSYAPVLNSMKNDSTVRAVSDVVLKKFEIPADQSESVCQTRANSGQGFYDKYKNATFTNTTTDDTTESDSSSDNSSKKSSTSTVKKSTTKKKSSTKTLPKNVKEQGGGRGDATISSNSSGNLTAGTTTNTSGKTVSVTKLLTSSTTPSSTGEKYLSDVLTVLLQIAENTLTTSQKLELLKNLETSSNNVNIVNGGNTNNVINNSSGSSTKTKTKSRNSVLASKIAQGIS